MSEQLAQAALEQLLRAEARVRRSVARADGLSGSGWSVLVLLCEAGGELAQATLRERLGTSKANASEVLSALERRGLLARRPLARDRRASAVVLTAAGREYVERLLPEHEALVAQAFAQLDEHEQRSLELLCRKLAA